MQQSKQSHEQAATLAGLTAELKRFEAQGFELAARYWQKSEAPPEALLSFLGASRDYAAAQKAKPQPESAAAKPAGPAGVMNATPLPPTQAAATPATPEIEPEAPVRRHPYGSLPGRVEAYLREHGPAACKVICRAVDASQTSVGKILENGRAAGKYAILYEERTPGVSDNADEKYKKRAVWGFAPPKVS